MSAQTTKGYTNHRKSANPKAEYLGNDYRDIITAETSYDLRSGVGSKAHGDAGNEREDGCQSICFWLPGLGPPLRWELGDIHCGFD